MTRAVSRQWDWAVERENNILVTGALLALLQQDCPQLTSVKTVVDEAGDLTNALDITLSFMKSPYRIYVERVMETEQDP